MRKFSKALGLISLLFGVIVLLAGYWLERSVSKALKKGLEQDLTTLLESNVEALQEWMSAQERAASLSAAEPGVREAALAIVESSKNQTSDSELFAISEQRILRQLLQPTLDHWEFESYVVITGSRVVGTESRSAVRRKVKSENLDGLQKLKAGASVLSRPQLEVVEGGRAARASMWVASPLRDDAGKVQGALAFRINPQHGFTRILQTAHWGDSGETYAFDESGLMLSGSRFEEQLRKIGLLKKGEDSSLRIRVQDPGVDLTAGGAISQGDPPLTLSARSAVERGKGVSVRGYRDYRGVEVVGAWTWLDEYAMGITTEINRSEAFASVAIIRKATWALCSILLLVSVAVIVAMQIIRSLHNRAETSERLGQYTLEQKLGQGGMGAVYKARHALLRRPTAIKVIRPENIDDRTRIRFEREVQATAKLCHPNTIAIYDYGQSQSGVFYYAMEYLDGIDLHQLVKKTGRQPEARVMHILLQVLASLAEAHEEGMVHRDVKPPNIMLCRRGGMADVVKVLDFGLVKEVQNTEQFTIENALTGTPQYMAPETVTAPQQVDQRTDLYAIGAVGFFLLAGRELFTGPNVMAVLTKQMADRPPSPSLFTERPITPAFEKLLLQCLEKQQDQRPATARNTLHRLEAIQKEADLVWTQSEANDWWEKNEQLCDGRNNGTFSGSATVEIDLKQRFMAS